MDNRAIGVFDSGIGGLTVAKEIINKLPKESIVYLGDTARVPYGNRSKTVVTQFARELVNFLLKKDVKALVVACNTISALALDELKKISPVPVLGVIDGAIRDAVNATKNKKIGVIGTQGTIQSKAYEQGIKAIDSSIEVISVGCPLFVPLIEEGLHKHEVTKSIAHDYLDGVKQAGVDTLILGCTHYPLLLQTISETVGNQITLIDSAVPTTESLKGILTDKNLLSDNPNPNYDFYVTDDPERVYRVASRFFGSELEDKIKKVNLE